MFYYCTVCPTSLKPIYIVSYYIKGAKTSWTYSMSLLYVQEVLIEPNFINWVKTLWTDS